jgi:hypothetical protein
MLSVQQQQHRLQIKHQQQQPAIAAARSSSSSSSSSSSNLKAGCAVRAVAVTAASLHDHWQQIISTLPLLQNAQCCPCMNVQIQEADATGALAKAPSSDDISWQFTNTTAWGIGKNMQIGTASRWYPLNSWRMLFTPVQLRTGAGRYMLVLDSADSHPLQGGWVSHDAVQTCCGKLHAWCHDLHMHVKLTGATADCMMCVYV